MLRPRVLVYAALLLAIGSAAAASLYMRVPLKLDVIRDRAAIGVGAATSRVVLARVRLPADASKPGSHRIEFRLRALGVEGVAVEQHSVFIVQ